MQTKHKQELERMLGRLCRPLLAAGGWSQLTARRGSALHCPASAADDVLEAASRKVEDAVFQAESTMVGGNQTATPEYTLAQGERVLAQTKCGPPATWPQRHRRATDPASLRSAHGVPHSDFATSVLALLQGASPTKVMSNANELASVVEQVLANCKVHSSGPGGALSHVDACLTQSALAPDGPPPHAQGVTRLAADESVADQVMADAKGAAQAVQALLLAAQSTGGALHVRRRPRAAKARPDHCRSTPPALSGGWRSSGRQGGREQQGG